MKKALSWKNFWIITGYISSVVSALLFLFADLFFSDYLSNSEIVYYRILFFVNSLLAVGSIWSLKKINYWTLKLALTTLILFSSRIVYVTMIDNTPVENANVAEKYAIDLLASRAEKKQKDRLVNLEDKVSELEKEREVKDSLNSILVDSINREKQQLNESLAQQSSEITLLNTQLASVSDLEKELQDWREFEPFVPLLEAMKEDSELVDYVREYLLNGGSVGHRDASKYYPIIITDIEFANTKHDRTKISEFGNTLYNYNMRFLMPKITFIGNSKKSEEIELGVKIIKPSGELAAGSKSPAGYSYKITIYISSEITQLELIGFGNNEISIYTSGEHTLEIWYSDRILFSKKFQIF